LFGLEYKVTDLLPVEITGHIPASDQITLRMLLNHTSGIFDFQNDGDAWDQDFLALGPDYQWSNLGALSYAFDRPLNFAPGTAYRYSNTNYVLIALIIEAVTGEPVNQSIRARILEPLGLGNTYHGDEASGVAGLVHGYVDVEGEALDVHAWYNHYGVADAGIQSTTEDMARFMEGLVKRGSVLGETILADMLNPSAVGEPASNYGLGITIIPTGMPDTIIYRHSGKDPGSQALMMYISGKETSIAIAASASFDDYDLIFNQISGEVFALLEALESDS
jgi:D-alanyl-D-alanine carboxypeptidase